MTTDDRNKNNMTSNSKANSKRHTCMEVFHVYLIPCFHVFKCVFSHLTAACLPDQHKLPDTRMAEKMPYPGNVTSLMNYFGPYSNVNE